MDKHPLVLGLCDPFRVSVPLNTGRYTEAVRSRKYSACFDVVLHQRYYEQTAFFMVAGVIASGIIHILKEDAI